MHCDDEGISYLYVPKALWPGMEDCAAAMGVDAVILWDGPSGSAFEEASIHPYLEMDAKSARLDRRVVTTVEFRGLADVDPALAESDADGLYRLLVARGVIVDKHVEAPKPFAGVVADIENVEMIATPRGGAVLFEAKPGELVKKGQRIARVVYAPGEVDGEVAITAPQSGYVFTRASRRIARAGDDIFKIAGDARSADARSGVLED